MPDRKRKPLTNSNAKTENPDGMLVWVHIRITSEIYDEDDPDVVEERLRQEDWRPCLVLDGCLYQPGVSDPLQAKRVVEVGGPIHLPSHIAHFYAQKMLVERRSG